MGILKSLFKSTPPPEGPTWEIVETPVHRSISEYQVRIKRGGREFYAEDFFQTALKTGNLQFQPVFSPGGKTAQAALRPLFAGGVARFTGRKTPQRRV